MAGGHLQKELKKRRPFESQAQEAVLNLLRTNDQIQIRFARLFGRHDGVGTVDQQAQRRQLAARQNVSAAPLQLASSSSALTLLFDSHRI